MIPIAQTKLPPAKSANKFTGGRLRLQNYYCDHSNDGSDDDNGGVVIVIMMVVMRMNETARLSKLPSL